MESKLTSEIIQQERLGTIFQRFRKINFGGRGGGGYQTAKKNLAAAVNANSIEEFNSEVWMTEFPGVDGDEICVFVAVGITPQERSEVTSERRLS